MIDASAHQQPIKNLSVRIRRAPGGKVKLQPRKPVDYSAGGDPVRADAPITVGPDPLLQLLKGGNR